MFRRLRREGMRSSSSSSTSSAIKTAILLLHRGVPRTQFYAKEQLAENASLYYRVPLRLSRWLTELGWKMSMKTRSALDLYGDGEQLNEQLDVDAQRLSNALEQILPEFSPTQALPALLYGQPSIETQIENVLQSGARRLVLLPLDAHFWCFGNGTLINRAVMAIENHSRTMILDDQLTHSERVPVDDQDTFRPSLHCSVIDRWSSHPLLAEFWAKQIVEHCEADSTIESLLFVAPKMIGYGAEEYWIQVGASCLRVLELMGNVMPWKLASYSSWDQWPSHRLFTDWMPLQLHHLHRVTRQGTVLVVPISTVLPNIDTVAVLPRLLDREDRVKLAAPPVHQSILTHGFAELIRNHLLAGRPATAQFSQLYCRFCNKRACEESRRMLGASIRISHLFAQSQHRPGMMITNAS